MTMTHTHTYVILEVSQATYDEIGGKLEKAGYTHAFTGAGRKQDVIDMHGIALQVEEREHDLDCGQIHVHVKGPWVKQGDGICVTCCTESCWCQPKEVGVRLMPLDGRELRQLVRITLDVDSMRPEEVGRYLRDHAEEIAEQVRGVQMTLNTIACVRGVVDEALRYEDGGEVTRARWQLVAQYLDQPLWLPMNEEAKKAGEVLVYAGDRLVVAHWCEFVEDHPPIAAGWYYRSGRYMNFLVQAPTHWMRLPPVPR